MIPWSGGDTEIEDAFKKSVDAIIGWGGGEMIHSYRNGLPAGTLLIEHGPKISIGVITKSGFSETPLDTLASGVATDVALWDQAACASLQTLFIEDGLDIALFIRALGAAFDKFELPRGVLDDDEYVEILKEKYRAKLSTLTEGGRTLEGKNWFINFDPAPGLRGSPLNRTLILKSFRSADDLVRQIEPFAKTLQSCGYALGTREKDTWLGKLAACGLQRFAPLGNMMSGMLGAPHDGRFSLQELVRFVGDECRVPGPNSLLDFVNDAIRTVPFYGRLYEDTPISSLSQLRPVSALDFAKYPVTRSRDLLRASGSRAKAQDGYIFSSGGTTGEPKFVMFSAEEFERVGAMLARGYIAQGLSPGDLCANLFVAGNLWSSFMAVERALVYAQAIQLPIGGGASSELILSYLQTFKPRIVFGLPSLLVGLAHKTHDEGLNVSVPWVCYAGEHLTKQGRAAIASAWGTSKFFSAGYASVDAGPIGYQCSHCDDREHHLFSSDVHLEIIDGEAVVTSRTRQLMPVIHLKTGDHVEWSSLKGWCACGSTDPKFILHGRTDGQINIWSSRIHLEEIETALVSMGVTEALFQITLSDEHMDIAVESSDPFSAHDRANLYKTLHQSSKDLKLTHPLEYLNEERLTLRAVPTGSLPRVARTGKIRTVIETRR